jgi:hypothetical protein
LECSVNSAAHFEALDVARFNCAGVGPCECVRCALSCAERGAPSLRYRKLFAVQNL